MTGQTIRLIGPSQRDFACRMIAAAPDAAVVNIREATRSGEQNAKLWAMLSDVSRAMPEGRTLTPEVWKALFMHSLSHAQLFEMALDGRGVLPVGFRSSRLSKAQMGELIECVYEYGARHGVQWTEPLGEAA